MPRDSHFKNSWLHDERFKCWVRCKSDAEVQCAYCFNKTISIANGGESALKSHAKGAAHLKRCLVDEPSQGQIRTSIALALAPPTVASSKHSSSLTEAVPSSPVSTASTSTPTFQIFIVFPVFIYSQLRIDSSFTRDNTLFTEMRWCLHIVQQNASFNSCNHIGEQFHVMFPNSVETEDFKLGRTKCSYFVNFGFALYYSDMLFASVQDSRYYALSFDESLNKSQQSGQMDIDVRFWNSEKCATETRYFNSEFLRSAKAEAFQKATAKLDASKLL